MSEKNTTPAPEPGTPEWIEQQMLSWTRREAEIHARGITGLKSAIPFLAELGIKMIVMEYNGEGDSGDIESFTITGKATAPTTTDALDKALERFSPESGARERFCTDKLKDYAFEILPGGFEINEGSYGQVIVDCENNKVRLEHSERIMEINYNEREW